MKRNIPQSDKKAGAIQKALSTPFEVGENCCIKKSDLSPKYYEPNTEKGDWQEYVRIYEIIGDTAIILPYENGYKHATKVPLSSLIKNLDKIGENPFEERNDHTRTVNFAMESILFKVGHDRSFDKDYIIEGKKVDEVNWNPFVYNKQGQKEYYQRPFVWTLKDNQLLVESIYRGIECGRILVRKRSWSELTEMAKKGETELAFTDIVDGKQRLNAVINFIEGNFSDMHGNYFADLSDYAQRRFTDHQLFAYAEMPENSKDADVLYQFLRLNFSGVPQSEEHIDFVKSLQTHL